MKNFNDYLAQRGAVSKLAKDLGITHSAVLQWRGRVPASRIAAVERLTGIPRSKLRPDLRELFKPGLTRKGLPRPLRTVSIT